MSAHHEQARLAFVPDGEAPVGIEIRVSFGVFAGRNVMLAEIDRLAAFLLDEVPSVTVISEDRHQIGRRAETSLHQVRVEVAAKDTPADPADRDRVEQRLLERLDYWARTCIAERRGDTAV